MEEVTTSRSNLDQLEININEQNIFSVLIFKQKNLSIALILNVTLTQLLNCYIELGVMRWHERCHLANRPI